jgi:hypothetical protein
MVKGYQVLVNKGIKLCLQKRGEVMNYQYNFVVNDKVVPYYHFKYEKEFKEVIRIRDIQEKSRKSRYYFKDGTYLPQYISQETTKQFDFQSNYVTFERVMIVIVHWFPDFFPKDLDNYYYKPFIDVFRRLKIIEDDSWKQVGVMNLGEYADKERIDIYIIPYQYFGDFITRELFHLFDKEYQISPIEVINEREELEKGFFY